MMTKVLTKGVAADRLPINLYDIEAVREASQLCNRASEQLRVAEAELAELTSQLEGGDLASEGLAELAERALRGESLAATGTDTLELLARVAEARRRLKICAAAEKLAIEKAGAARQAAFDKLVADGRQAYAEIVGRLAESLVALRRDVAAEIAFRDIYLNGHSSVKLFTTYIPSMCVPFDDGRVGRWLQDGIDAGLLPRSAMDEFCGLLPTRNWQ
ncbi:MAG: hypothetical protein ACYC6N_18815 [Pirellulaceae bacterium]